MADNSFFMMIYKHLAHNVNMHVDSRGFDMIMSMISKIIASDITFSGGKKKKKELETLWKCMQMICEYVHSSDCNQIVIFKSIMSIAQSNVSSKKKKMLLCVNKFSKCKHISKR